MTAEYKGGGQDGVGGGGGGRGGLIWFPGPPVAQTHIPVLPPLPVPGKSGG